MLALLHRAGEELPVSLGVLADQRWHLFADPLGQLWHRRQAVSGGVTKADNRHEAIAEKAL
jgi:hypothetical protein